MFAHMRGSWALRGDGRRWGFSSRHVLMSFISLLLLAYGSSIAVAARPSPWSETVKKQKKQNAEWLKRAKQKQAQDFKKAEQLFKGKDYEGAEVLYRRVLNTIYPEWTFTKAIKPAIGKTREGVELIPRNRRERIKVETSYNKKANARLEQIELIKLETKLKESISSADKLASEGKPVGAYLLYLKVAKTSLPRKLKKYHEQANNKGKKIVDDALALLKEIDGLISGGKFDDAKEKMINFDKLYGNFKESPTVLTQYREVLKNPKMAALERELHASRYLRKGLKHLEKREYAEAMKAFAFAAETYHGTPAGKEAAKKLRELHADPNVQNLLANAGAEKDCRRWLIFAENFEANGKYGDAAKLYKRIMGEYPGTSWANEAKERLKQLRTQSDE